MHRLHRPVQGPPVIISDHAETLLVASYSAASSTQPRQLHHNLRGTPRFPANRSTRASAPGVPGSWW